MPGLLLVATPHTGRALRAAPTQHLVLNREPSNQAHNIALRFSAPGSLLLRFPPRRTLSGFVRAMAKDQDLNPANTSAYVQVCSMNHG